jgi:CubicO group peptidase (beta-lactamase class C family)
VIEGHLDPAYAALVHKFQRLFRKPGDGGGALSVFVDGSKVVDVWAGYADFDGHRRWQADTVAMSFSTTKGVASTVAHRLVGDGVLSYDEPLTTWWPEFGAAGKQGTTLRDVMTHRAGLHNVRSLVLEPDDLLDHELMEHRLAAATAHVHPGGRSGYHAITYGWLIGGLVRRATGVSLTDQVQLLIAKPLGLEGLNLGLPLDKRDRNATLSTLPGKVSGDAIGARMVKRKTLRAFAQALLPLGSELMTNGDERLMDVEMPSVNGYFDARSLAKMYGAIARGGEIDGVRILSRSTVDALSTKQVTSRDYAIGFPMGWRLGYHQGFVAGKQLPRAFGHFGFGGAGAWCDLDRRMSLAFVTNRMAGLTTPFADARLARLGSVAVDCHAKTT